LKEKAYSLLNIVGLKDWANIKTKKFSKGMLQRLGIAQALINDPHLLFLDEPTDGVDPIGRKEIRDLLVLLNAQGTTIFLNSHLLSEVELICNRVAILNKGIVVRTGTISEITTQKLAYIIQLSEPVSGALRERLKQLQCPIEFNETSLIITLHDKSELNSIIDILRADGVGIESMTQQKTSLEDYFIQVMKGENTP
jgi:ABC-2 type transport system ATP-binding protein